MTTSTESHVRFDPYDVELIADPYPMFARLRDEAPLYYNAEYDFFALSRFADVNKALVDHATFSSARGVILDDGRDQAVELAEIEFEGIEIHVSIPIKKPAKLSAGSGFTSKIR